MYPLDVSEQVAEEWHGLLAQENLKEEEGRLFFRMLVLIWVLNLGRLLKVVDLAVVTVIWLLTLVVVVVVGALVVVVVVVAVEVVVVGVVGVVGFGVVGVVGFGVVAMAGV